LLNQFLDRLKPFLVARVFAQRPSREDEDVSLLRRLKLSAIKSLDVSYCLELEGEELKTKSNKGTYLDQKSNTIYIRP